MPPQLKAEQPFSSSPLVQQSAAEQRVALTVKRLLPFALLLATAPAIGCSSAEYAQYKDRAKNPESLYGDYCLAMYEFDLKSKLTSQNMMADSAVCSTEMSKMADALSSVKAPLPDCVARDPKLLAAATCNVRTERDYSALYRREPETFRAEYCQLVAGSGSKSLLSAGLAQSMHCGAGRWNALKAVKAAKGQPPTCP